MELDGEMIVDGSGANPGSRDGGGAGGSVLIQTAHFSGNSRVPDTKPHWANSRPML